MTAWFTPTGYVEDDSSLHDDSLGDPIEVLLVVC
jgi:hypothetical protein